MQAQDDRTSAVAPSVIVTTQQTGKAWKIQLLLSALIAIAGVISLCVGVNNDSDSCKLWVAILLVVGILWFIVARLGAWWFHG